MERDSLTATLAERAIRLSWADLPADLIEWGEHCLIDWFAVAIAGSQEDLTDILVKCAIEDGEGGKASLVGRREQMSIAAAALINGAASHALDYDDVNFAMGGHATVTIVPALLAIGEKIKASGRLFIESFIAGYETAGRIGQLVAPSHYEKGFHVTGTVGSFAAAAAASRMLGLDSTQASTAFGIAASQAAGLKSNFGTMCKPLHAGTASEHGLRAARLAANGFSARRDVLECNQGFAATQSNDFSAGIALGDPPKGWHLRSNLFKYHASCYLTHAPIECARAICLSHHVVPDAIRSIRLRIDAQARNVCNIPEPATGLEAKFSLHQTVAMALAGVDTSSLASYAVATIEMPEIVALRGKVSVDFLSNWTASVAEMTVQMEDGTIFVARHDSGIPSSDLTKQRWALELKFNNLVTPVLGPAMTDHLLNLIRQIASLDDVGDLARAAMAR